MEAHGSLLIGIIVVTLALVFTFSNGFHDSANIIATMVSTRAITPNTALLIAALFEFLGAYFLGTQVAKMITSGIADPFLLKYSGDIKVIIAALMAAIGWNVATWYFCMPASSSHTLIGSLFGSFACGFGFKALLWHNIIPIIAVLICAPLISFLATYFITNVFYFIGQWFKPGINVWLNRFQVLSSIGVAMASGNNDAQKSMGVITFSLIILGFYRPDTHLVIIPHWVILSCSVMIGLGIAFGGWRLVKTLGMRLYTIRAVHGFAAQSNSLAVIYLSSILGFPISATQVVASSIMGAGASEGFKRVRWNVFFNLAHTWLITLPVTFMLSYVFYIILDVIN